LIIVIVINIVFGKERMMAVLKYSRQRESIKNFLCGREDHPTADMVYTNIRKEYPNISLGTVYRNLSLLVELGEVRKITTDGADRFDARVTPHSHFICRRCGRVMDVMVSIADPLPMVNEQFHLGTADECRMEFYGICSQCEHAGN
jgi:Fur family peroxide stress response transcriptional regulator